MVKHKPCGYFVRTVHPAILRANKQVHREAYAIMVKTNRFIHCKFYGTLPMDEMMETSTRRIICHHRNPVEAFKGYTMSVSVVPEGLAWFEPEEHHLVAKANTMAMHCMILGEDCWGLLHTLSNLHMPNLGKALDISIAVAPYLKGKLPMVRGALKPFFNEPGTQENLLTPFRKKLRGIESIKITGVDRKLAAAAKEDMAKDEWTDAKSVLADIQATKQRGNDAFKRNELREASQIWEEAINDIERIHQSSSWCSLIKQQPDNKFIEDIVELYFMMCLNVTRVQLTGTESPIPGYPKTHNKHAYLALAEAQIDRVMNARKPDLWKKDYTWEASEAQLAKLLFRQAMWMKADSRLNGDLERMMDAMKQLALVAQFVPDDVAVRREMESLEAEYAARLVMMGPREVSRKRYYDNSDDQDRLFWGDSFDDDDDDDDYGFDGYIDDDEEEEEEEEDEDEDLYADMSNLMEFLERS